MYATSVSNVSLRLSEFSCIMLEAEDENCSTCQNSRTDSTYKCVNPKSQCYTRYTQANVNTVGCMSDCICICRICLGEFFPPQPTVSGFFNVFTALWKY
jgi:hypothetical protein